MKQYTTPEQTAKLVELGFEKPNGLEFLVREDPYSDNAKIVQRIAYSIGELIEMLPPIIDEYSSYVVRGGGMWSVHYKRIFESRYDTFAKELIDALYDMVVKLKEEGVI